MKIPGLPEGVECVRIGRATADEFEMYGLMITKGSRFESTAQLIVRPEEGYEFVYDLTRDEYLASKKFGAAVEITIRAKFSVANEREQKLVTDAARTLRSLPGYVE